MFGPATPLSSPAKRHIIRRAPYNNVRLGRRPVLRIEGDTMSDSIVVTDDGAVRVIRMNRPEKKNALTQPMYAAMTGAMREAEANEAIRCVVLAGGRGAFCAGADIGEFLESAQSGGLRPHTLDFLKALANNQKPLVAAVGGLAVGIGVTMLLHCDYVVASDDATFTTTF